MSTRAGQERKGNSTNVRHYKFTDVKEERINDKLTRRIIVGKNEMLGYFFASKGAYLPPHHHVSEQITIIISGALEFTTEGRKIVVKEGETLVIPPNVEHAALALEDTIDIDCFSPPREDWLSNAVQHLPK